ncbi:MAG TPA: hypothetical protein VIY66_02465 [Candidatus Acidoferrales bacterium]
MKVDFANCAEVPLVLFRLWLVDFVSRDPETQRQNLAAEEQKDALCCESEGMRHLGTLGCYECCERNSGVTCYRETNWPLNAKGWSTHR